jgi:hypothetical protein
MVTLGLVVIYLELALSLIFLSCTSIVFSNCFTNFPQRRGHLLLMDSRQISCIYLPLDISPAALAAGRAYIVFDSKTLSKMEA